MDKREYVKKAKQTRKHRCHWPDCEKQVPPAMWGCGKHWFKLPKKLRDQVWKTYVPGQEERVDPSEAYMKVAYEIQDWVKENAK